MTTHWDPGGASVRVEGASSLALLDPDRALVLVLEHAPGPRPVRRLLVNALGSRLLDPILARVAQPPFDKALMDGFAVRLGDRGQVVRCVGAVAAGGAPETMLEPGQTVEIMTGAPCPRGTEAVVKVEDVLREGDEITLPPYLEPGQHIQPEGLLCKPGEVILPKGTLLTSLALATALSVGATEARVGGAPSVAIVTTGDELATPGTPLGASQIYNSNGPMLQALALAAGASHVLALHARDSEESLGEALAAARDEDILVFSGGVSMGRYDLVPGALVAAGFEKIFHRVAQKPGKPIFFGVRGSQLAFGLPGTPLGSHLGFHRYVAAAIRRRLGSPPRRRQRMGRLTSDLRTAGGRTLFRLVAVEEGARGWDIDPLKWGGSSDLAGPGRSNAYIRFDPGERQLRVGDVLPFELIDSAEEIALWRI